MDGGNLAAITSIVFLRAIILEIEIECKVNTQVKKGVRIAREIIKGMNAILVLSLSRRDDGGNCRRKRSL